MMNGCANASRKVRAFAERRRGGKVGCFFPARHESRGQIAALDGVGGVLGHVEQLGEFRPVGAAGEEGVDQRRGDDAEQVEALLFLEGLVVSGLLLGEVGVALFDRARRTAFSFAQSGVFILESSIFLAQGLGLSLCGGVLLVPPVQRLIAELLGLLSSTQAPRREIDRWRRSYELSRCWHRQRRVKPIDIRLIDRDRSFAVEDLCTISRLLAACLLI